MQVKFYHTTKRENSTLVPQNASTTVSAKLKDAVSYINPVLLVTDLGFGNAFNSNETSPYNMCSFGGKYYKILDVTQVRNDLWKVACEMDVLATYKDDILATYAYVAYASTDASTSNYITDNRFPMLSSVTRSGTIVSLADSFVTGGHYFLSVTGNSKTAVYSLSLSQLNRLLTNIETWGKDGVADLANITEENALTNLSKGMWKLFVALTTVGSATDNIRGCIWHPWSIAGGTGSNESITIGNYDTRVIGYRIDTRIVTKSFDVTIPWQKTGWKNKEPYTRLYIYLPYIGFQSLSASELQGINTLRVMYSVDLWTGDVTVTVSAHTEAFNYILGTYGGNSAMSVPIGLTVIQPPSVINSIQTASAIAVSGGLVGSALGAVGMGAMATQVGASLMQPNNTTIGGLGNASAQGLDKSIILYSECNEISDSKSNYNATMGVPVCKVDQLINYTGYVKTNGFSISIKEPFNVCRKINTLLDGGIYIE